ncbi:MAG: translocase [Planctomycetaceae bacterium]|nr:translocase [Planctomycetaceae bacterium]
MSFLINSFRLQRWRIEARRIEVLSDCLRGVSDAELEQQAQQLRWRAWSGEPLKKLMRPAYAMVREASRRVHNQSHFRVQLMAGIGLFQSGIAEMQTGEGKTLTALLPSFLRALVQRGCHVVTANDYLASRDAEFARAVLSRLGMTVGCIQSYDETDDRRVNYACDITYGTAKEMGFDFLRDRLRKSNSDPNAVARRFISTGDEQEEAPVQRGHYFALVDEADSILIDDAKTPLLIALTEDDDDAEASLYRWSIRITRQLQSERDFYYDNKHRRATLLAAGCRRIAVAPKPARVENADLERLFRQVERALTAQLGFQLDRDYVVADGKIAIVDESTGRVMEGRKWQEGLHQAIEAKEGVEVTAATVSAARITVQSFFSMYEHLSGLTGTAKQSARELKRIYNLGVVTIPTNRACIRMSQPERVFVDQTSKLSAVAEEIKQLRDRDRAVLVGTPSVRASESLSKILSDSGIEHEVLNAYHHEQEADVIARAGQSGQVTIATNMAGRGTDILIDDEVRAAGGLHVIATEMHTSPRIDRQLVGRTARQGDPGSYQFFLSLEDELFASDPNAIPSTPSGELPKSWLRRFKKQQSKLVKLHTKQRRQLLKHEEDRTQKYERMGLDPHLELSE